MTESRRADLRGAAAMSEDFWRALDELVSTSRLVIDRPRGSAHPRYPDITYPLDYGYLADTTAADGDGIDVWLGSLPERRVTGIISTVDLHKRDAELKLLLGCTPDEARSALAAHQNGSQAGILLWRDPENSRVVQNAEFRMRSSECGVSILRCEQLYSVSFQ
ncbi:MAG: inorganic pyrophosphatase [Anaerolineae bacterium]